MSHESDGQSFECTCLDFRSPCFRGTSHCSPITWRLPSGPLSVSSFASPCLPGFKDPPWFPSLLLPPPCGTPSWASPFKCSSPPLWPCSFTLHLCMFFPLASFLCLSLALAFLDAFFGAPSVLISSRSSFAALLALLPSVAPSLCCFTELLTCTVSVAMLCAGLPLLLTLLLLLLLLMLLLLLLVALLLVWLLLLLLLLEELAARSLAFLAAFTSTPVFSALA
mmetsp:Transcript_97421/g.225858  ORF Transcript_97421/g.225858 Transcript_97421/m.225858 type:complete len:223 (+) Transcript_97421:105-773(+)